MSVIEEIAAERRRQIDAEGRTSDGDDQATAGQLAVGGACYALSSAWDKKAAIFDIWPFAGGFKPKDPRRDLIRAGALIVAEIERLDRTASSHPVAELATSEQGEKE